MYVWLKEPFRVMKAWFPFFISSREHLALVVSYNNFLTSSMYKKEDQRKIFLEEFSRYAILITSNTQPTPLKSSQWFFYPQEHPSIN